MDILIDSYRNAAPAGGLAWANVFLRMPLNSGLPFDVSSNEFAFADRDRADIASAGTYADGGIKAAAAAFGAAGWRVIVDADTLDSRLLYWTAEFLSGAKATDWAAGSLYVFGTQDWCIECTVKPGDIGAGFGTTQRRISLVTGGNPGDVGEERLELITAGDAVHLLIKSPSPPFSSATIGTIVAEPGDNYRLRSGAGLLSLGVKSHIAAQRVGSLVQVLCDGAAVAQCTISYSVPKIYIMSIGATVSPGLVDPFFMASNLSPVFDDIDDVRIVLGQSVYGATYTVPAAELPVSA